MKSESHLKDIPAPEHIRSELAERLREVKLLRRLLKISEDSARRAKTEGGRS